MIECKYFNLSKYAKDKDNVLLKAVADNFFNNSNQKYTLIFKKVDIET